MKASFGLAAAQASARLARSTVERPAVLVGDRADAARHRLAAEPGGAAALLVEPLVEIGVVEQVAMRRGLRRLVVVAAAKRADTGQPMADIKGVGDLAELAVADAVDAGRDLFSDDVVDRGRQTGVERRLLDRPPGLARFQELEQVGRARQAADMRRQDAFAAVFHLPEPRDAALTRLGGLVGVHRHRTRAQRAQHKERQADDDEIHDRGDHEHHVPAAGRGT